MVSLVFTDLVQRPKQTRADSSLATCNSRPLGAPGDKRLLGSALGDDFGLLVFHVSSFRGCCLICFFFAAVAGTRRHPTAKWVVVSPPLTSHASLSGCRDIHNRSRSIHTKCTGSRFRAGAFLPARTGIRVRTCSTRTNRNGLRRPCARAFPPAHTSIRGHACLIRNVCIWFQSFTPLAFFAAGHRVRSALHSNTRPPPSKSFTTRQKNLSCWQKTCGPCEMHLSPCPPGASFPCLARRTGMRNANGSCLLLRKSFGSHAINSSVKWIELPNAKPGCNDNTNGDNLPRQGI